MSIRTPLCDLFGIEHPVLLAPMAGVSGGAIAAAVSRAGGLGLIGGGTAMPIGSRSSSTLRAMRGSGWA